MKTAAKLSLLLMLLLALTACAGQPKEPVNADGLPLRITVVLPHEDNAYWYKVHDGVEKAGQELCVDVKVEIPQLNYNVSQMTQIIKQATAAQVDAIILQGNEDEEYAKAILEAEQKGIPVVFVDCGMTGFEHDLFIGTDNFASGVMLGEQLVKLTGGSGEYAVLSGSKNNLNLDQRMAGIESVVKSYPALTCSAIEYDQFDAINVMAMFNKIRQEHPDTQSLVCLEGTAGLTFGMLLTGETKGFEHILAFDCGNDMVKNGIKSGAIDGVVVQNQGRMGYLAVSEICSFYQTGAFSSEVIYTPIEWITEANIERLD